MSKKTDKAKDKDKGENKPNTGEHGGKQTLIREDRPPDIDGVIVDHRQTLKKDTPQ